MSKTQFKQTHVPDQPLQQAAGYEFDAPALQNVDQQIRDLQSLVATLIAQGSVIATRSVDGASDAIAAGDVLLPLGSSTSPPVTRLTTALLASGASIDGIAAAAPVNGKVVVIIGGFVPGAITSLGSAGGAVRSKVAVHTSGASVARLYRTTVPDGSELIVGTCSATGDLTLLPITPVGSAPPHVIHTRSAPYYAACDGGSTDDGVAVQAAFNVGSGQGSNLQTHVYHPRSPSAATATTLKTIPTFIGNNANAWKFTGDRPGAAPGDGTWFAWKGTASPLAVIEARGISSSEIGYLGIDGQKTALSGLWIHSDQANSGAGCSGDHVHDLIIYQTADSFPDGTLFQGSPHSVALRFGDVFGTWGGGTQQCDTMLTERVTSVGVTSISLVVHLAGTGPAMSSPTGKPLGTRKFRVEVTTGATLISGNMRFRWSDDNGSTWTSNVVGAATVLLAAWGITIHFAAGTYVNTDVYTWTTQTSYAGWQTMEAGNTSDHRVVGCNFSFFQYGLDWSTPSGALCVLYPTFGPSYQACMHINGGGQATIISPTSQSIPNGGAAPFIHGTGGGGGALSLIGASAVCDVSLETNKSIIRYADSLYLQCNYFDGTDQAGSTNGCGLKVSNATIPAKPDTFTGDFAGITSVNNWYKNVVGDQKSPTRVPMLDGSLNDLTGARSDYAAQNKLAICSLNDRGGAPGHIAPMLPYVGAPWSCQYLAPLHSLQTSANGTNIIRVLSAGEQDAGKSVYEIDFADLQSGTDLSLYIGQGKKWSAVAGVFLLVEQQFLGVAGAPFVGNLTCAVGWGFGAVDELLLASDLKAASGTVYGKKDSEYGLALNRANAVNGLAIDTATLGGGDPTIKYLTAGDYIRLRVLSSSANFSTLTQGKLRICMRWVQVFDV